MACTRAQGRTSGVSPASTINGYAGTRRATIQGERCVGRCERDFFQILVDARHNSERHLAGTKPGALRSSVHARPIARKCHPALISAASPSMLRLFVALY